MGKKILIMLIAAVIGLTGCTGGRQENQVAEKAEERMKISIAVWDADEALAGDVVLEGIEEKFNVEFEPINMSWDDYYQKVERWASTGSLPDLFVGDFRKSSLYIQWINQGLLCAIPENLSDYPNLESYMSGLEKTQVSAVNGRIYCIPRQTYPAQEWTSIDRIIAYRWDLAQKAGITEEPENWEEFQKMILAIIKEDPENMGIQGMTAESPKTISGILLPYASSIAVSDGNGFFWKQDEGGIYKPVYFADNLLPAFQLGRDMYETGVIEKDFVLQTNKSAQDKFQRGESAAILYSGGYGGVYEEICAHWKEYHGRDFTQDVKALRLMPDVNGNKAYPIWGYAWSESYINAKVSEEKLDKILQIYDYLLSDEGAFLATYGPEGELYEVVDGRVTMYDNNTYVAGKYPSCGVFSVLVRWVPDTYDKRFVANIPESYNRVNLELMEEAKMVPIPEYEPECSNVVNEEGIDFQIQVGDDFLRIMTAEEPVEESWEEIRQEYEEKGLQDMIDAVNAKMKQREKN